MKMPHQMCMSNLFLQPHVASDVEQSVMRSTQELGLTDSTHFSSPLNEFTFSNCGVRRPVRLTRRLYQ